MICCIGNVCADIVSFMPAYPEEDSDNRCATVAWARGGNAANSATILSCIGAPVEFLGTIANDAFLSFQKQDMTDLGIRYENCPIIDCGPGPLSLIICSQKTGSRTIVHAKGNLPELKLEDFTKLNLAAYSWIHFEGRNANVLPHMLKHVREYNDVNRKSMVPMNSEKYKNTLLPVSLEVELPIDNLEIMLPLADVVIVGKDYAKHYGAKNSTEAAEIMLKRVEPGTVIICPWGDHGASYCTVISSNPDEVKIHKQNAYLSDKMVDSLGAGDTFNAVSIYCLQKCVDLGTTVDLACRVASKKIQMRGLKSLNNFLREVLPVPSD